MTRKIEDEIRERLWLGDQSEMTGLSDGRAGGVRQESHILAREMDGDDPIESGIASNHERRAVDASDLLFESVA
jgi:hypothetical protein